MSVNLSVDGCLTREGEYSSVRSTKAIQFRYVASDELTSLFEDFRLMCNDAVRIALKEKPRSRLSLRDGLSPTEGVRSSHPLHPVCMRSGVLGLSEQR